MSQTIPLTLNNIERILLIMQQGVIIQRNKQNQGIIYSANQSMYVIHPNTLFDLIYRYGYITKVEHPYYSNPNANMTYYAISKKGEQYLKFKYPNS